MLILATNKSHFTFHLVTAFCRICNVRGRRRRKVRSLSLSRCSTVGSSLGRFSMFSGIR